MQTPTRATVVQGEYCFRIAESAICIADDRATIFDENEAFERLLGECRGRTIVSLMADRKDGDAISEQLRHALAGARVAFETSCKTPSGPRVLSWRCRGADRMLVAAVEDVTERDDLRRTLARKEAEVDGILRALPDIYFRLDADGRISAWHAQRQGELHVPPEQFIGRRPQDVVPPDVAPLIASSVARARSDRQLVVVEYTLATPSGDDQFEARLVPHLDDEIIAVIRNITDRRRAETALRASEEQLRASQKMEALGRLAGGVAHDFNNLLTVIVGRLELVGRHDSAPELVRAHCQEALTAAGQASSLTRRLLALSRRQVLQPSVLDLNGIVSDMHDVLRRLVGEDIDFALSLDESIGAVRVDRSQIEQVLLNLTVNARDAMPHGGTLTLSTREMALTEEEARRRDGATATRYVVLAVTDTGCGMTTAVIDHMFEPFFTTKPRGQGTGLGLAIVYGIVKQSEGHLVVRSVPEVGSTFEVCFPRAEPVELTAQPPLAESPPRRAEKEQRAVLVVEDEDGLRRLTSEVLSSAGYAVISAANGDEALRALRAHHKPIALLVTDLVMPGLDGRSLAARVMQLHPDIRVLLMSGHDASGLEHEREGWPLLEKPFTVQMLLTRVREALATPSTPRRFS